MTEPNLLPCPFCASEDLSVELDYEYFNNYAVNCNDCEAIGGCCYFQSNSENESHIAYTKDEAKRWAINKWNMRVSK